MGMESSRRMHWGEGPSTISAHAAFIQEMDWSATDLGPSSTWPEQLSQAVDFVLADPTPAAVMWGERLTMIYNEGFVEFAGAKHPKLMGSTPDVSYAEVWSMFLDIIERGRKHGQATRHENVKLYLDRNGFLEECFVTYTFVPLIGRDRSVVGFYHTATETTREIRAARRMRTLLRVGDALASSRCAEDYWASLLKGLSESEEDVSWIHAYTIETDSDCESVDMIDSEASVSIPESKPRFASLVGSSEGYDESALQQIDLDFDDCQLARKIKEAMLSGESDTVTRDEGDAALALFQDGLSPSERSPRCGTALLIPIRTRTHALDFFGLVIIGLAPGAICDEDCLQFGRLFTRQAVNSAASAVHFQQEAKRRRQLVEQLSYSTKRTKEAEQRLSRFVEVSKIGMWIADSTGELLDANKAWYDQAGVDPSVPMNLETWTPLVAEDSLENFRHHWAILINEHISVTFECKFKSRWKSHDPGTGEPIEGARWFLVSALPEFDEFGGIKNVWGCNVDVSYQKWAQALVSNRLEETLEAKRQTENFIDMVSHEIRNPLSAITQSADNITTTIATAIRNIVNGSSLQLDQQDVESITESASIIGICAQHQKTIVDDILTLSKLDASLLTVKLEEANPVEVIHDAIKLHQQQFETSKVEGCAIVDPAYYAFQIGNVFLDRNRVFQVLINMLTNAIKFTRLQSERKVTLHLSASLDWQGGADSGVNWMQPRRASNAHTKATEKLENDEIYIHLAVEDTGCGISHEEMQHLFSRFSQASPRTQVRYGGSGLGLFICKELIELQGGRIGLSSTPDQGSTFRFCLKVKRGSALSPSTERTISPLSRLTLNGQRKRKGSGPVLPPSIDRSAEKLTNGLTLPSKKSSAAKTDGVTESPVDESQMHVLVVEDNMINQRLLASQLRKAGCIVHTANHGGEALTFLKTTTFATSSESDLLTELSVVLMDLEMPVMDGLTCTVNIRRMQKAGEFQRHIPVLAVTANARAEHIEKAKNHGMDDAITKPFTIKQLIPRMRNLIAQTT